MVNTKNINSKIYLTITVNGFWKQDVDNQKRILEQALRKYMISKLHSDEIGLTFLNFNEEIDIVDLFEVLSICMVNESKFEALNDFIQCLLNIAGDMQNHCIIWKVSRNKELIDSPIAEFNEDGKLISIITNEKTDYLSIFRYIYNLLMDKLMDKKFIKSLKN